MSYEYVINSEKITIHLISSSSLDQRKTKRKKKKKHLIISKHRVITPGILVINVDKDKSLINTLQWHFSDILFLLLNSIKTDVLL